MYSFDLCNGGRGASFAYNNPNVKEEGGILTCSCGDTVYLKGFNDSRSDVNEPIIDPIGLDEVGENTIELGGKLYNVNYLKQWVLTLFHTGKEPINPLSKKPLSMFICRRILCPEKTNSSGPIAASLMAGFDGTFSSDWCTRALAESRSAVWSRCNGITNTGTPFYAIVNNGAITIDMYHKDTSRRNLLRVEIHFPRMLKATFTCQGDITCVCYDSKLAIWPKFRSELMSCPITSDKFSVNELLNAYSTGQWSDVEALLGERWDQWHMAYNSQCIHQ